MEKRKNIQQLTDQAFEKLTNHKPIKASDDFFEKVQAKIDNTTAEARPATIYTLSWQTTLKYAALIAIMAMNGLIAFQVFNDTTSYEYEDDYSVLVDEYFPEYETLTEEE